MIASAMLIALTMTACGSNEPAEAPSVADSDKSIVQEKQTDTDVTNILVAYFSRADENYSVGTVEVGNTQILAEFIADEVGADSFHIETVNAYPAGYDDCCDVAKFRLTQNTVQGQV